MTTDVISENTSEQNGTSDGGGPYTGIVDTTIYENVPTTNDVNGNSLRVREHSSLTSRILINFDTGLSNISGPVTVTAATIYLNIGGQNNTTNMTLTAYDVLQSVNYSQTTWNIYSTGNNWDSSGCSTSGTDYVASALGSGTTGTGSAPYWMSITGANLAQAVEDYINGSRSALDIIIRRTDASSGDRKDPWSENQTFYTNSRPELVVTYTSGGGTGRIMSSLTSDGGLAGRGGIAGIGGGLAG